MHGTYIGKSRMLISTVWGGKIIAPSDDLSLTPELVLSGGMELPLTKFFINHVKPGNSVFDVGANIGYFTTLLGLLVGSSGKVIAYEANRNVHSYLMDNLSINYLHDRSTVFNKAVYSENKMISLYAAKRYMGNSSIHPHSIEYFKHYIDEIEQVSVEAILLDQHADEMKEINFLKIDIEGGEYHAFLGMQNMIKQNIVKTIVFELNKSMMLEDWHPFVDLLLHYRNHEGKSFFSLSEEGNLVPVHLEQLIELGGYPYVVMQ